MIGQGLRAMGVLAFVIIPLDALASATPWPAWATVLGTTIVGGGLFALGVIIELARHPRSDMTESEL